jgi:LPXTG-site transpeptidase (sortase) family protein
VTALTLGAWSALVWTEAEFFKSLPVPTAAARSRLPGEDPEQGGARLRPSTSRSVGRGEWVARLEAPAVGLAATVLEGSDEGTLARAAGHIETTAMPGEAGNIGIAGHRDTTFRPVRSLKMGDTLALTTADHRFEYRISKTMIVEPEDVYVLDPTPQPTLTLVTCYPFTFIGHAPQRFIVRAELVASSR